MVLACELMDKEIKFGGCVEKHQVYTVLNSGRWDQSSLPQRKKRPSDSSLSSQKDMKQAVVRNKTSIERYNRHPPQFRDRSLPTLRRDERKGEWECEKSESGAWEWLHINTHNKGSHDRKFEMHLLCLRIERTLQQCFERQLCCNCRRQGLHTRLLGSSDIPESWWPWEKRERRGREAISCLVSDRKLEKKRQWRRGRRTNPLRMIVFYKPLIVSRFNHKYWSWAEDPKAQANVRLVSGQESRRRPKTRFSLLMTSRKRKPKALSFRVGKQHPRSDLLIDQTCNGWWNAKNLRRKVQSKRWFESQMWSNCL